MILPVCLLMVTAGALSGAPAPVFLESQLSAARLECREYPGSAPAWDRLAALELKRYRLTHDAETLARASADAERALAISPGDFDARRFQTAVLLTYHRFLDVERHALDLSAERPLDADVLGMLADARMESGQYDAAVSTIDQLVQTRPGMPAYSRVSYAREILGDVAGAITAMDDAIAAGDPADAEALSWCLARSALLCWKTGRLEESEARYRRAFDLCPNSTYALEGLGRLAAGRGDTESASKFFERAFSILPWPQYAVDRLEIAQRSGDTAAAGRWRAIVGAVERLSLEKELFNRVLALFEADDGDANRAVAMAQAELVERKDVYGFDALAWALYRAGRTREAADAARQAVSKGTQDPLLDDHAGVIFAAAGQTIDAIRCLSRALAENAFFDATRAEEARRLLRTLAAPGQTADSR